MKVTLNWLKQSVDFNWSPKESTERFAMLPYGINDIRFLYENACGF